MICAWCQVEYQLDSHRPRVRLRTLCLACALVVRDACKGAARERCRSGRPEAYDLFIDWWHREPRLADYSFLHPSRRRAGRRRVVAWEMAPYLPSQIMAERMNVHQQWAVKLRRRSDPGPNRQSFFGVPA